MALIDMKDMIEMAKIISGYSREEALRRYEVCRDRFTDDNVTEYKKFDMAMEASMLLQRIVDIAKEELKEELQSNEPDINTDAWIQVPKGDDMKFWLNRYGLRRWNINGDIIKSAERAYYWVDRMLFLDENRRVLDQVKFSDFIRVTPNGWTEELPKPGKEIKPKNVV